MALEGNAFRRKVLDTDELMDYCGLFAVMLATSNDFVAHFSLGFSNVEGKVT
ncbi:hypothetical protein AAZX31_07G151100 [Glycine max]